MRGLLPPEDGSTGPINQAAATCLGNINLVEDVDVSVGAKLSFGTFLSIPRGMVGKAPFKCLELMTYVHIWGALAYGI